MDLGINGGANGQSPFRLLPDCLSYLGTHQAFGVEEQVAPFSTNHLHIPFRQRC
jgi:hypothetical protein